MAYAWLMIVRAIASLFAIIELGLTVYGTPSPTSEQHLILFRPSKPPLLTNARTSSS